MRTVPISRSARPFVIVVTGHGPFPEAMLRTAEIICGMIANASTLSVGADDSLDSSIASLDAAIGDNPGGTLVLCDMHGGTPANAAAAVSHRRPGVAFVSGANLAMVVEAVMARGPLDEALLARIVEAGRSGMAAGAGS